MNPSLVAAIAFFFGLAFASLAMRIALAQTSNEGTDPASTSRTPARTA